MNIGPATTEEIENISAPALCATSPKSMRSYESDFDDISGDIISIRRMYIVFVNNISGEDFKYLFAHVLKPYLFGNGGIASSTDPSFNLILTWGKEYWVALGKAMVLTLIGASVYNTDSQVLNSRSISRKEIN